MVKKKSRNQKFLNSGINYIYFQACAHTHNQPKNNSSDMGNLLTVGLLMIIFLLYLSCVFQHIYNKHIWFYSKKSCFKYLAQKWLCSLPSEETDIVSSLHLLIWPWYYTDVSGPNQDRQSCTHQALAWMRISLAKI